MDKERPGRAMQRAVPLGADNDARLSPSPDDSSAEVDVKPVFAKYVRVHGPCSGHWGQGA